MSFPNMNTSLKINKRARPSAFKKLKNVPEGKYKSILTNKKATPNQLKQIRENLKKENKKNLLKKVFFLSFIFIVLFLLFSFL